MSEQTETGKKNIKAIAATLNASLAVILIALSRTVHSGNLQHGMMIAGFVFLFISGILLVWAIIQMKKE